MIIKFWNKDMTKIPSTSAQSPPPVATSSSHLSALALKLGVPKEKVSESITIILQFVTNFKPKSGDDEAKKLETFIDGLSKELSKAGITITPEQIKKEFGSFAQSISQNFSVDSVTQFLASKQSGHYAKIDAWIQEKFPNVPVLHGLVEIASKFEVMRSTASVSAIAKFVVKNPIFVLTTVVGIIGTGVFTPPSMGFAAVLLAGFLADYANQADDSLKITDAHFRLNDVALKMGTDRSALVADIDKLCTKDSAGENPEALKLAFYSFLELSLIENPQDQKRLTAHLSQLAFFVSKLQNPEAFLSSLKTLSSNTELNSKTKEAFEKANHNFQLDGNDNTFDKMIESQKSITEKILSFFGFGGNNGTKELTKTFGPALDKFADGWKAVLAEAFKNYISHQFSSRNDAQKTIGTLKSHLPSKAQFESAITKTFDANAVNTDNNPASALALTANLFDQLVKDPSTEITDPAQRLSATLEIINNTKAQNDKKRIASALKRMAEVILTQSNEKKLPDEVTNFADKVLNKPDENNTESIISEAQALIEKVSKKPAQT